MAPKSPEAKERKREYNRKWAAENRERLRAYHRQWYAEHNAEQRSYFREWHKNNPDRARAYRLATKYKTTVEEIAALQERQDNKCALCLQKRTLVIDHCHTTGRIRGLLCVRCNNALGAIGDDEAAVLRALEYVRA